MSWNSSKPWLAMVVLFLLTGSSLAQVPDDRRPKSIPITTSCYHTSIYLI